MCGRRLLLAVVLLALAQGCAASDPDGGGAGREAGRQVGTYDGSSFTVVRAQQSPPGTQPSAAERFRDEPKPACREPAGGSEVPYAAHRSQAYVAPAAEAARAEPDFAGVWVAYLQPMGGNVAEDPGEMVLNVAFTGDLARHRAELRRLWGGRLCVTRLPRSYRKLQRIQDELDGAVGRSLGVEVLKTGLVDNENAVHLEVVVLDQAAREAIRRRYDDAVRVTAKLTPVP